MLDIGWSELMVVAIVLVIVVGPKDLPRMLRTFGRTSKQLRSMAGDFRRQFDDALREAELDEVKNTVSKVRDLDPTKDVRAAMNPMKAVGDEIRSSLKAATKAPEPKVPSASGAAVAAAPDKVGVTQSPATAEEPAPSAAASAGKPAEAKEKKSEDAA
ncbi:Sec-independent protein translocase protein TatB [Aurantimonas sp. A2-1-M11]|uniref:Sec-independent protein translocase protein TatB n=1 Tax=Aurantimonas sp. A2-1-M11 TaxID=3113712 RepID=UPI002F933A06